MANIDKDIVIIPNKGSSSQDPSIKFTGADSLTSGSITLKVINSGTAGIINFQGTSSTLVSISDNVENSILSINNINNDTVFNVSNDNVAILANTSSTSSTTGALTVLGGVGINENLYVGGTIYGNVDGTITSAATVSITNDASNTSYHYITFVSGNSGSQSIKVDSGDLVFQPSTGNLGIGDTNPSQKLVVSGKAVVTGGILGSETGSLDRWIWAISGDNSTSGLYFNGRNPDYIEYRTTGTTTTRISLNDGSAHFALQGGKVGIRTGTPVASLDVAGSARIQESFSVSRILDNGVTYDNKTFDVSAQEESVSGIMFKPDGTKMFIIGNAGDDITEYLLNTPWEIDTAVFQTQSASLATQNNAPTDFYIKPDGTKLWMIGSTAPASIFEYSMSMPWDISSNSLSYDSISIDLSVECTGPADLYFKPDGTKLFILNNGSGTYPDSVLAYNLPTPWTLTGATFENAFSVATQETAPHGLSFSPDGFSMFVLGTTGDDINVYNLATAWNVSTAIYSTIYSVSAQTTEPRGMYLRPDGQKLYIVSDIGSGAGSNRVYQYTVNLPSETSIAGKINLSGDVEVQQNLTVYGKIYGRITEAEKLLTLNDLSDTNDNFITFVSTSTGVNSLKVSANTGIVFKPSTKNLGIGKSPDTPLHIYRGSLGDGVVDLLKLEGNKADFGLDPAAIALVFKYQDGNNATNEARIRMASVNDTDYGDNDEAAANLIFSTTNGGVESDKLIITGDGRIGVGTINPTATFDVRGSAVFNEDGANFDFRVEGDSVSNLIFVDASADSVGIGVNPQYRLDVAGSDRVVNIRGAGNGSNSLLRFSNGTTSTTSIGYNGSSRHFIVYDDVASAFRLVIDNDGKTGLAGITTPSAVLDIGGIASTNAVRIRTPDATPWAIELFRTDLNNGSKVLYTNSPYQGWNFEHNILINGNTNWHSGNDGSGSGLDADLLDGFDSSYFAPAIPPNVFTNSLTGGAWYTIAINTGSRAFGRFILVDKTSGLHQSVHFDAAHHFGTDASNLITVISNSWYAGPVVTNIRIKENSTYQGAALQIYLNSNTTNLTVYLQDNWQSSGWVLKQFVNDSTDPGDLTNWADLNEITRVTLNSNRNGLLLQSNGIAIGSGTNVRLFQGTSIGSGGNSQLRIQNDNAYGDFGAVNSTWFHHNTNASNGFYWYKFGQNEQSWRAPIFYDSDNTNYYLDPASSSRVADLRIDTIWQGENFTTKGPITSISISNVGSAYTDGTYTNVVLSGGTGIGAAADITIAGGVISSAVLSKEGTLYSLNDVLTVPALGGTGSSGTITATGVRTATLSFHGDPTRIRLQNSDTSLAAGQELGSILFGARDANTGGSGDVVRLVAKAEGTTAGGRLEIWTATNGNNSALNTSFISNYAQAVGSFRAPIFYDSNNTSYYADPSSTSQFYRLNARRIAVNPDANTNDPTLGTLSLWNNPDARTSTLMFKRADQIFGTHGAVTDTYATFWLMDSTNRGLIIRHATTATGGTNVFSIRNNDGTTTIGGGGFTPGSVYARLNIHSGNGSALNYRDIDLFGNWTSGEEHSITATYGADAANIVGQFTFRHTGPQSSMKWGRLYHSGNSSVYPMELTSESLTSARLEINNGSIRAPIFYDYNDTNYYVDPSSTSVMARITMPQNTVGVNYSSTSTQPDFYIGQQRGNNDAWKIFGESPNGTNTGNLVIQSEDDFDNNESIRLRFKRTYGAYDTRDVLIAYPSHVYAHDMRAPIFYDNDDTNYYGNFAGRSVINELDALGPSYINGETVAVFFTGTATPTTGYLITTTIPFTAFQMPLIRIEGYAYGNAQIIDFALTYYTFPQDLATGNFINRDYINYGTFDPGTVSLSINASNFVCIHFTSNIYYGRFAVKIITKDFNRDYLRGWTVTTAAAPTGKKVDLTKTQIWNSTNDGSGSGLDADLLDGLNSDRYTRIYPLPNTGSTGQYIYLGRWESAPQNGRKIFLKIAASQGYNASSAQNGYTEIYFKTSNGSSTQAGSTAAFYGDGQSYRRGNVSSPSLIRVVQINVNTFDFYALFGTFTGDGSFYTVDLMGGSWTHAGTLNSPTGNYIDLVINDLWHTGNDGSGSGLDADLLDGYHETDFLRYRGAITEAVANDATTDAARTSGWYRISYPGASDALLDIGGIGGSTPRVQFRFNYGDNLWFRAARDSETNWDSVTSRGKLMWHSGNDGSGSGLDADLLDGQHGSYYAPVSALDNYILRSGGGVYTTQGTYGLQTYPTSSGVATTGGWARSHNFSNGPTNANYVSFGAYGGDGTTINYGYIARGTDLTNYNSSVYIRLYDNYTLMSGSARSPIFYDSNNTNYYVNPASTSELNAVRMVGNLTINNTAPTIYLQDTDHRSAMIHNNSNILYFLRGDAVNSTSWTAFNGYWPLYLNLENNYALFGGTTEAVTDFRAPVFYDSNNTAYLINPASTSYVAYLGRRAHETGHLVGSYNSVGANSTFSNPIYTIGSNYNPLDTALSNMYGIGYTNVNASFITLTGASGWGMYVAADGDARVWLDGSSGRVSSTGAMYTPIYYDYNNTAYYLDPASTSNLNYAYVRSYQQDYNFDAPGTPGTYVWVRASISGFNGGGDIIKFTVSRSITDNSSTPYGGPSMDVTVFNREWHSGQSFATIVYDEHGSASPVGQYISHAGPRDLASNGYWFYMRIAAGIRYKIRVASSSGNSISSTWAETTDPGSVQTIERGYNIIGAAGGRNIRAAGYIKSESIVYGTRFEDVQNTAYYLDPNNTGTSGNFAGSVTLGGSITSSNIVGDFKALGTGNNYDLDRTTKVANGLAVYSGYSTGANRPWTYDISAQFVVASRGFEISADWIGTTSTGLFVRSLRDCCQNWSEWSRILTDDYAYASAFYDRDNTGFYADPNSTSRLNSGYFNYISVNQAIDTNYRLIVNGAVYVNGGAAGTIYTEGNITTRSRLVVGDAQTSSWINMVDTDEGTRYIHNNSSTIGFVANDGNWAFRVQDNGNLWTRLWGDWVSNQWRSSIFYDYNDTYYRLDPNGTTRLSLLSLIGSIASENLTADYSNAALEVREYAWGGVQTDSWAYAPRIGLHWGGRVASQIGLASNGRVHILNNPGTANEALQSGTFYAPIFYDSNNTNYYLDPNGGSRLATITNDEVYNYGWFRNYTSGRGLYNQASGMHWYSNNGYWKAAGGNYGYGGTVYYNAYESDLRGYVYYDGSGFGLLNSAGSWQFRIEYGNANAELYRITYANDLRPYIIYDRNNTTFRLDPNGTSRWNVSSQDSYHTFNNYGLGVTGTYASTRLQLVFAMGGSYRPAADGTATNNMYGIGWSHPNAGTLGGANFLNDHGILIINNGTFRAAISSRAVFSNEVWGTNFVDYNNTGYYCNPNGTSNLQYITARTKDRIGLTYKYNTPRGDYTGDVNYWVGSMGWGTTDLNTVFDWGSGFIDSWSNPGNQPAGTSHWVGVQALHYTNVTNRYGWQLVGGPIQGLWFRNTWGGFSGWKKIAMHGVNEYSGSLYANIYYDSDDAGYYLDPNSTSNAALRIRGGALHGPNPTWGKYLYVGTDGGYIGSNATVAVTNGNLHVDAEGGYNLYLAWYNTSDILVGGGIQALIYYDRNNTGYYADPAGTSIFNNLTIGGYTAARGSYRNIGTVTFSPNGQSSNTMTTSQFISDLSAKGMFDFEHSVARGSWWYAGNNDINDIGFNGCDLAGTVVETFYSGGNYTVWLTRPTTGAGGGSIYVYNSQGTSYAPGWRQVWTSASDNYNYSSIQSPIYYDVYDTAFRIDANSDSYLKRLRIGPYAGNVSSGNVTGLEILNNGGGGDTNVAAISFHCSGTYGTHLHLRSDGYFGAGGWSAAVWRWYINMNTGDMTAAGNVVALSDIRLKEEIKPIIDPLGKILSISGVKFKWKSNSIIGRPNEYDYGVLAQEIEKIAPEIVTDSMHDSPDGDKYKTVAYDKLVPILIEAIKEQQSIIEGQKSMLDKLSKKIDEIYKQINKNY